MGYSLLVSMASLICLIILPIIFVQGKPSKAVVDSLALFGVLYDNGDVEVLCLDKECWELIDNGHKPRKVGYRLQKLRCRVNYHALKFTDPIIEMVEQLVHRMRMRSKHFIALHLRILNSLNIPLSLETVCVFTVPIFSANAAWATYLLTKEVKGTGAGLTAAALLDMFSTGLQLQSIGTKPTTMNPTSKRVKQQKRQQMLKAPTDI
ncbi:hypothetical protein ACSBR1_016734 [Camellia fascicularis]